MKWGAGSSKDFLSLLCNIDEACKYLNIQREEAQKERKKKRQASADPKGIKGSVQSNSGHGWKESSVWITDKNKNAKVNKKTNK